MVQYMDNKNSGFNMWNANRSAAQPKRSPLSGFLWWTVIFIACWWAIGAIMGPRQTVDVADTSVTEFDLSAVPVSNFSSDLLSISVQGLRISDINLSEYRLTPDGTENVVLFGGDGNYIESGLIATGTTSPVAETVWTDQGNIYTWTNSDGVVFTRSITIDGYVTTVLDTVQNNSGHDISVAPYVRIVRANDMKSASGVSTGAIAYVNSDTEQTAWTKLDNQSYAYSTTNGFAGFADQYWETVASISSPDQTIRIKRSGENYVSDTAAAATPIANDGTATFTTTIFTGPRDQSILDTVESKIPGISETIDYGWFWFLARPMLWLLNAIHHVVMNYGVAIIIMTILLRLLMWPLTRKSYVSMAAMQKMQPEMQRIQKLYANDKMRLQMEMMKLYQTHKTSPMSGCLPMLIQIPIFFALYKALLVSVAMRNAHFLWISDLSAMDPYFILPIMMGLTMYIQQRFQSPSSATGTGNDAVAQTQRMMRWMPLLFTVMFAWMPAGLVLYWTVSNIFGIVQMQIIKRQSK